MICSGSFCNLRSAVAGLAPSLSARLHQPGTTSNLASPWVAPRPVAVLFLLFLRVAPGNTSV